MNAAVLVLLALTQGTPSPPAPPPPAPSRLSDHAFCEALGPLVEGPAHATLLPGRLGGGRPICARNAVGLSGGLGLAIDLPRFYGALTGSVAVDGRLRLHDRIEVFAEVEAFRYERVIAPFSAGVASLGYTALGATGRLVERPRAALGLSGRVVLPTAFSLHPQTAPFAFDFAALVAATPVAPVLLRLSLGVLGSAVAGPGPDLPRFGVTVTGGLELRPVRTFAFVADLHGRFGYGAPLSALAGAFALRFSDDRRFSLEIGAALPFAGQERKDAVASIRAQVELGPRPGAAGN